MAPQSLDTKSRKGTAGLLKTIADGSWKHFLISDALATRKSIRSWWFDTYLASKQAEPVPQAVSKKITQLLLVKPPNESESRASLDPAVQRILQLWEDVPLVGGSPERAKAVARCIADLVLQGLSKQEIMSLDFGTEITELLWGEARLWLYKDSDGNLQRHRPLQQPFPYKELTWDADQKTLVTGSRDSLSTDVPPEPRTTADGNVDAESLRISHLTFNELLQGTQSKAQQHQDHEPLEAMTEPLPPREPVEVKNAVQPATSTFSLVMRGRRPITQRSSPPSDHDDMKEDARMTNMGDDSDSSDDFAKMEI
ncbi:MAG: hypothetical protein Q9207_001373 [Kuettlingeria erythrocarpa]